MGGFRRPGRSSMRLSIVIPTLRVDAGLDRTLRSVAEDGGLGAEIVVAYCGADEPDAAVAARPGLRVLRCRQGRGVQLAAGAEAATGDWLLFLHDDTALAPGWAAAAVRYMAEPENLRRAAVFRFALDDAAPQARRLERLVAWRCRVLGLPYGDQGLLLSRRFYEELGGYAPIVLMEDVELGRRIGRGRLVFLEAQAVTSARRYREGGWLLRPLRNLACLGLYLIGVPPRLIARLYA